MKTYNFNFNEEEIKVLVDILKIHEDSSNCDVIYNIARSENIWTEKEISQHKKEKERERRIIKQILAQIGD